MSGVHERQSAIRKPRPAAALFAGGLIDSPRMHYRNHIDESTAAGDEKVAANVAGI